MTISIVWYKCFMFVLICLTYVSEPVSTLLKEIDLRSICHVGCVSN